ncbi:TonB-dependent receptor [Pelagicoccus mobilis]|uniref:TonB-dependent receptor n=1 Tax=Pelagicoccus mobilis TaxID=415221 RepID=A0A934VRT0_9BACT|nr:TonB-dependent receptor [Pelagicoccus mobilis]MBK1877804.1 TonB-dependent receptor [Pelagicoccus mobilis]
MPIAPNTALVLAMAATVSLPTFGQDLFEMSLDELLEVKITSQKREEDPQKASLSVTAINGQSLSNWEIGSFLDLDSQVPGLVIGRSGYDPRPAIRGARTQQVEHNDLVLASYNDGVYQSRHAQTMRPYLDLERVEILRGPQGTLFGRNSYGGATNALSQKPELGTVESQATLTLGSDSLLEARAFTNMPIGDTAALRFSLADTSRDGYIENRYDPDLSLGDRDGFLARGQLLWEPTEQASLRLKIERWEENSNGYGSFGYKPIGIPIDESSSLSSPFGTLFPLIGKSENLDNSLGTSGAGIDFANTPQNDGAAEVLRDPYHINSDYPSQERLEEDSLLLEWEQDFDEIKTRLVLGHTDFSDFRIEDGDFSTYNSFAGGQRMGSQTTTGEFQVISPENHDLLWVFGIYYLSEDLNYAFLWRELSDLVNNAPDPTAPPRNEWASWMEELRMRTKSLAPYFQITSKISDSLSFTFGARHTSDERTWSLVGLDTDTPAELSFNRPVIENSNHQWERPTWKVGLEWNVDENSFLYATGTTGFMAGNFKTGTDEYDEQEVTAFEVGYKTTTDDDRIRLNAAFFFNEYEDLLATTFVDQDGTTIGVVDNVGSITSSGLEVEFDWLPLEALHLGARASVANSRYDDFVSSNPFQTGGQTIDGTPNQFQLHDSQVAFSPDLSVSLFASYDYQLANNSRIVPRLMIRCNDDYRANDEPYQFARQPSTTLIDLSLAWHPSNDAYSVKLFASNLTDELKLNRANRFGGDVAVVDYAPPRRYSIQISKSF